MGRSGLSLLLEGEIDRGNITIEATTTMEAFSSIRNVVTIRPLSISQGLICQRRSMGSQNGGPRLGTEAQWEALQRTGQNCSPADHSPRQPAGVSRQPHVACTIPPV